MLEVLFTLNITILPITIIFCIAVLGAIVYLTVLSKQKKFTKSAIADVLLMLAILGVFLLFLLKLGTVEVKSYGFCVIVGFVLAALCGIPLGKKHGIKSSDILDMLIWTLITGFLGGRILYVLTTPGSGPLFSMESLQTGINGLSFHGGLTLAVIAIFILSCIKKIPPLKAYDLLVPLIALGYAFGRVGCFLNHCCYGKAVEHKVFFGVQTQDPHIFEYPVQLYSTGMALIIFAILYFIAFKYYDKIKQGILLFSFLILMGIERFIMEIYRHPEIGYLLWHGLTKAQIVSIILIIISIVAIIIVNIWGKKE